MFCDIKLVTEDGGAIFCHKVVLASASPYFHAMFVNFVEKNQYLVVIRELDKSGLQLLIDFIYSGEITITEKNVQVITDSVFIFNYKRQNCLNWFLYISQGFVTRSESFAVRRSKRGLL